MKDVLIDAYATRNLYTGLGQISANFIEALALAEIPNIRITLLTPRGFAMDVKTRFNLMEENLQNRYFPGLTRKFDLWHSLQQFPSHFPGRGTKQILTIHDLNFLVEKSAGKAGRYLNKLQKNVDRADAITAISNTTKEDIQKNIDLKGKPVRTIYNGVKLDTELSGIRPGYLQNNQFFFAIGVFRRKKNFEVLLPMMKNFEDHHLVIAGDNESPYGNYIEQQVRKLGMTGQVVLTGKVGAEEKSWLYHNCDALMVPSLAEGFGLPVIEAMLAGRPVFLNNISTLKEIGGDAAYYFDNFNENSMAELVKRQLSEFKKNEIDMSHRLISYGSRFSWKKCIEDYLALYVEMLES